MIFLKMCMWWKTLCQPWTVTTCQTSALVIFRYFSNTLLPWHHLTLLASPASNSVHQREENCSTVGVGRSRRTDLKLTALRKTESLLIKASSQRDIQDEWMDEWDFTEKLGDRGFLSRVGAERQDHMQLTAMLPNLESNETPESHSWTLRCASLCTEGRNKSIQDLRVNAVKSGLRT